jgi:hypothetical protein
VRGRDDVEIKLELSGFQLSLSLSDRDAGTNPAKLFSNGNLSFDAIS